MLPPMLQNIQPKPPAEVRAVLPAQPPPPLLLSVLLLLLPPPCCAPPRLPAADGATPRL